MRHGSLFSGIGGFDLAAQWMNWTNVFHTEWNEFGQKILQHHFPKSISYHDIIKTDFTIHRGTIDIITGGFPCQPFSHAGKRKGSDDERYLWHEMLRAIQELQPTYVVAENVRGLLSIDEGMVFQQVCLDLEAEGYEVQPILLPAAGVNAPHRRDRIFIVAYSNKCDDRRTSRADEGQSRKERLSERHQVRQSSQPSEVQQPAANAKDQRTGRLRNESSKERTRFCDVVSGKPCGLSASTEPAANTDIDGWTKVVFASDCKAEEWDTDRECIICPKCKGQHAECECTGPTQDGFEYRYIKGVMYAKPAANTKEIRLQGRIEANRSKRKESNDQFIDGCCGKRNESWKQWPTESAICGRNDGIPNRLDNITFPKWRNESIKAYGNAVVPQLILPIFQTIEKLHREKK